MVEAIKMMAPNGSTLTVYGSGPNKNGKFECASAAPNGNMGAQRLELSENEITSKIEKENLKFVPPNAAPTIKYDELDEATKKYFDSQVLGKNLDIAG